MATATPAADWTASRSEFFECVVAGDVPAATALAQQLAKNGHPIATINDELFRPTQQRVGSMWQTNQWTVADEHLASVVVEAALLAASSASSCLGGQPTRCR